MNDGENKKSHIHALSGVLLIAVDGAFFGANAVSLGLATPLICLISFACTGIGVFLVQKFMVEEDAGSALAKGFVLGVLAGIPTPIAGTLGGGYVIAKAGLRAIRGKN